MTTYTKDDHYLYMEGTHYELYEKFGAHVIRNGRKIFGTCFRVYAPNAKRVSVVGDFNEWQGHLHVMNEENGVWTLEIEGIQPKTIYKYEIETHKGERFLKADPFAFYAEQRPQTASVVYDVTPIRWADKKWLNQRRAKSLSNQPLNIYEVHLGSWMRTPEQIEKEQFYSFREITHKLINHVKEHAYTHIELLPIYEHPFDLSWGYQATGYFAPSSRYGDPKEFMYFVNECHKANIGVLMDWAPGHFCKDAHGLRLFDGSPLYEYPYEDISENVGWGTSNFNLGYGPVQSFLISNAMYWMNYFHIDGLRVDAVANMIYWLGDESRGVNQEALDFFKRLNTAIKEVDSSFIMMAEDSTAYPNVTARPQDGGLGFDYKWNMGWMNDTLDYMEIENWVRKDFHQKITFSMAYAYSEHFILPFSHDEVVHGKKSLVDKSCGDYWQKMAQFKLLMTYQMTLPGKKLNFMGNELAQFHEWKDKEQVDWQLQAFPAHDAVNRYVKDLNALYLEEKALWELDQTYEGFEWIDVNNTDQSIFSYSRKGQKPEDTLIIILNFKPVAYHNYRMGVPYLGEYVELLNSDRDFYHGSNQFNGMTCVATEEMTHGKPCSINVTIAPYGALILKYKEVKAVRETRTTKTKQSKKSDVSTKKASAQKSSSKKVKA